MKRNLAASARMKGRYSDRLTDDEESGRHKSFRTEPEFYRLAIESLSEYALLTLDRELTISSWSAPAARIFGYEESEIIGKKVAVLFTPEDVAKGVDRWEFEEALKHGRQDDERWHVRKDGRRLWCYGLSFPLKDERGEVRGFVKLIRDDTGRKEKDVLLLESEQRLTLAAESTGLGMWDYVADSDRVIMSSRAAELFGVSGSPSCGYEALLERIDAKDRPGVREHFARVMTTKDEEADLEFRVEGRWVRAQAKGFFGKKQKGSMPSRLIGTIVDVTERRRARADAGENSRRLEARVKERTARLTALNKELETFAYSASHDLRAPLRKITAFSEAIMRSPDSTLGERDRDFFGRIRASAGKMQQLIEDILNLARATRKQLATEDCHLTAIARETAEELKRAEPGRSVEFVIQEGIHVLGDPELLKIALFNLLSNAWKFTSKHPRARVEFGVEHEPGKPPVYFVRDDGAGFDMRFAHKLFGAFQRLHKEEEFPGTGVGLGLVERIVRRHRGRIWAKSEVEKGATFYFTLHSEEE